MTIALLVLTVAGLGTREGNLAALGIALLAAAAIIALALLLSGKDRDDNEPW